MIRLKLQTGTSIPKPFYSEYTACCTRVNHPGPTVLPESTGHSVECLLVALLCGQRRRPPQIYFTSFQMTIFVRRRCATAELIVVIAWPDRIAGMFGRD